MFAAIWDCASNAVNEALTSAHPLVYPLLPYWTVIIVAISLSPFTVVLPQLLKGELTWPRRKDHLPDVWTIHGRRYNLTSFFDVHPGGAYPLRAAQGSDCTGLFDSCHTFIDRKVLFNMLARFEIKDELTPTEERVIPAADPFYEDLKQAARDHFKGRDRAARKMPATHLCFSLAMLVAYWGLIYTMVTRSAMWCIPLVGCMSWYFTGNVMHDASHQALSVTPWVNRLLSRAAFPFGINQAGWTIQHVMSHHIHTNEHSDVDLYHYLPLISMEKDVGSVHIVLHLFRLVIIASSAIVHLSVQIPYGLLVGMVDPLHGHAVYDMIDAILAHRVALRFDIFAEFALLLAFWGFCGWQQGFVKAVCFQLSVVTIGSALFIFFTQVSHLQEECRPAEDQKTLSFAKRQVHTSMDYAPDSLFWGLVSGGLNTQAIHHVFPSISAVHLRGMYPKFRQVCKKHDVQLKETNSLLEFVWGFVKFSN